MKERPATKSGVNYVGQFSPLSLPRLLSGLTIYE